jgi:lysophospholipase L1-like esterase
MMNNLKISLVCVLLSAWSASAHAQNILVKDGQKVAVLGDQVTRWDATDYAQQVMCGLEANGVKAELILVGNQGTTDKMLANLDENVIAKKPDWIILNCSVDDAWGNRTPEQYQEDVGRIVDKAVAAGIKVVLSEATMAGEDPASHSNQLVAGYNASLRQLAKEKNCLLAAFDMPAAVAAAGGGAQSKRGNVLLTSDYIFLNPLGNELLAQAILKTLGLNPAQIEKARNSWLDRTDLCVAKAGLTLGQYGRLDAMAAKQNRPTSELIGEMVAKALATGTNR